jgi:AraC-like DNA-binding protein
LNRSGGVSSFTDRPMRQQAQSLLSLAEVAARAGFVDQSQFSRHFKRLVGVTPGRFRTPARIA